MTRNKIKIKKLKKPPYDIPYFVTDNSKVNKIYKWKPKKNVDCILKDIYQWLSINKLLKVFLNVCGVNHWFCGLVGSEASIFSNKGFKILELITMLENFLVKMVISWIKKVKKGFKKLYSP